MLNKIMMTMGFIVFIAGISANSAKAGPLSDVFGSVMSVAKGFLGV